MPSGRLKNPTPVISIKTSETNNMKDEYFKYTFTKKQRVSKALAVFFLTFECCFGFNFGFIQSVKKEFQWLFNLFRRLTFTCLFIILAFLLLELDNIFNRYYFFDFVHYTILGIVSIIYENTYYNFLIQIIEISKDISTTPQIIFIVYSNFIIFGKILLGISLCFISNIRYVSGIPEYVFNIPSSALDVVPIAAAIIFYYVYNSVIQLRKSYEISTNTEELLKKYIVIADCYDRVKPMYSAMVFLQITTNVPKLMMTIYYSIAFYKLEPDSITVISQVFFVTHVVVQMVIPSFIGELIDSEVETLKLVLNNQLVSIGDSASESCIVGALRYMAARPLKHRVCRLLSTDLRLPVSVFSFCVTYMIVVIQLTHLV